MKTRFLKVLTLALSAALVLTACSTTTKKAQPDAQGRVETLRLAGSSLVGYPNPFGPSRGPTTAHTGFLFDTLMWRDANGVPQPWLATSATQSPDGKEWRFTLRDGVKFQDGQPLTADDVAFTWNYMTSGAGKVAGGYGSLPVKSVTVESPTVVVFRTDPVFAPFLDRVASRLFILPKHIWESVTDPVKFRDPMAVMGSGPFRLDSIDEAAGSYLYVANDDYFMGPPHVKRLEFVAAPNELLALQRGEIDVASIGAGAASDSPVAAEQLAAFDNPKYGQIDAPGQVGRILHFNLKSGFPISDRTFRQAVAYALDRQDMLKRILLGRGEVGSLGMLEPSNSPYVAAGLPTYDHNVAKANAMLDQIGLKDANGDGMRDLPDGSAFKPELLTNTAWNPMTAEVVKEYLRTVGIDITIKSVDQSTADATTKDGRYQIALIGYGINSDPDGLRTQFSATLPPSSFAAVHGWNNPTFEDLAAKEVGAVDQNQRASLGQAMQQQVAEDLPVINLYVTTRSVIWVKGTLDNWYYGGGTYPGLLNKEIFVTGTKPATGK